MSLSHKQFLVRPEVCNENKNLVVNKGLLVSTFPHPSGV